jgi:hypothetical protein
MPKNKQLLILGDKIFTNRKYIKGKTEKKHKIVYIDSYYAMNMIHATHIWMLMLLILDAFIEFRNR